MIEKGQTLARFEMSLDLNVDLPWEDSQHQV